MTDTTPRHALPLLAAGQAQKEMTHNEALAAIDLLLHPAVEAVGLDAPPSAPATGQAWAIGPAPSGAWTGRGGAVAGWSEAGWRFAAPVEGMAVWSVADRMPARWVDGGWQIWAPGPRAPAIADPAGGGVVDVEVRGAVGAILAALRRQGLIA